MSTSWTLLGQMGVPPPPPITLWPLVVLGALALLPLALLLLIKPARRRLRFSLRVLFAIMTLACAFLGYELNWIRQRRAALANAVNAIPHLTFSSTGGPGQLKPRSAPGLLWLFGEVGYQSLLFRYGKGNQVRRWMTPAEAAPLAEAGRLFPEAESIQGYAATEEESIDSMLSPLEG
jgi:hypothetical protein